MKKSLLFFFLLLAIRGFGQKQGLERVDSLKKMLASANSDTLKADLLNDLSYSYYDIDPKKGLYYGEQALKVAEGSGLTDKVAWANLRIGVNYEVMGKLPIALKYDFQALQLFEQTGDKKGEARALGNIGIVYDDRQDYKNALDYYGRAFAMNQSIDDRRAAAGNLNNIGEVYKTLGQNQKAVGFYSRALAIKTELKDKSGCAIIFNNMGEIYAKDEDFRKSLSSFLSSIVLNRSLGHKNNLGINYANVGEVYEKIALKDPRLLPDLNFADRNSALRHSELYLDSGIRLLNQSSSLNELMSAYKDKSEVQQRLGNFAESLASFKKYTALQDTLLNATNARTMDEIQQKYLNEKERLAASENNARLEREEHLEIAGTGVVAIILIPLVLLLNKIHLNSRILAILSTFSVIVIFEFVALLLHPTIESITQHHIIFSFILLVGLACVILPIHHHVDAWLKKKLAAAPAPVREPEKKPAPNKRHLKHKHI